MATKQENPNPLNPFEAYVTFLAVRAHFNQKDYSYLRYNGKVKASHENFLMRPDRRYFHRLGKHKDPEGYCIANFLEQPSLWVTDLFDEVADENYVDWVRRRDSLTQVFTDEASKVALDFDGKRAVRDGQHPELLTMYLEGDLCHETVVILDRLTGMLDRWDSRIVDEVVWPPIHLKLRKYGDLLPLESRMGRFRDILKQKVIDTKGVPV